MQRARLTARYSGSVGTVALSADDLPLGLQVMGFAGEDARLFAIAAALRIYWSRTTQSAMQVEKLDERGSSVGE